jgi:hypothetical protein
VAKLPLRDFEKILIGIRELGMVVFGNKSTRIGLVSCKDSPLSAFLVVYLIDP